MDTLLHRCGVLIVATLLFVCGPAGAQVPQAAGRFVAVTGDVNVVGSDGARRSAERGGEIRQGESIVTGADALAQARMSDGSLISVRADSEFKLEQFAYKGRQDRSASFVVSILKGGFRTITGLIAQVNRSGYRINTPAATIGVRGTHFEVVHVLPQIASQELPAGTYNRVFEGITTVQNPGGSVLQVVRDQTAFAALQGATPMLVAPPALIFGRPTPVPRAAAPQRDRMADTALKGADRAHKLGDRGFQMENRALKLERAHKMDERALKLGDRAIKPDTPLREAAPATPLDPTATLRPVPLSPIEITTPILQPAPIATTPTLKLDPVISPVPAPTPLPATSPTLSPTTTTTILKQPVPTTISPTLTR